MKWKGQTYWTFGHILAFTLLVLCILSVLLSFGLQAIGMGLPVWNGSASASSYSQSAVAK